VVRLHLGCGTKLWEGFTNVDLNEAADVNADLRSLPFEKEHADEIHAIHVLEHFYVWEQLAVLRHWREILKPNGKLYLEMPCGEKTLGLINLALIQEEPVNHGLLFALYGDWRTRDPLMQHKWLFFRGMMRDLLAEAGFTACHEEPAQYHVPQRDMRWVALK